MGNGDFAEAEFMGKREKVDDEVFRRRGGGGGGGGNLWVVGKWDLNG